MTQRTPVRIALVLAALVAAASGCSRNSPTEPWPPDPIVFRETVDFGLHQIEFKAFGGSKYDALSIDSTEKYSGNVSLKFTVPAPGDPSGGYAGGAFVASQARSLASFNALSFYVKASRATILAEAGFGNDNTGTSKYVAWRTSIPMTTEWTRVLIPIPLAAKLNFERGMFYVSEGPQGGTGLTFWVDEVTFVNDPSISNPNPGLSSQALSTVVGASVDLSGTTRTTFTIGAANVTVSHMPGYFSFTSSEPTVATVLNGAIQVVGTGSTTITAMLGAQNATGSVTLNASAPPALAAPTPGLPSSDVISIFSNAYTNIPAVNWRSFGSASAQYSSLTIGGNDTKAYTGLANGYVGIEFKSPVVNATSMTHFHMDVWMTSGSRLLVKLVDFGANGIYGADDTSHELTFNDVSTPPYALGSWVSLDLPFTSFTGLTNRAHLAQLILSGDTPTVFVDNIYFHK